MASGGLSGRIQKFMMENSPMAMQMGHRPSMSPEEMTKEADEIMVALREYISKCGDIKTVKKGDTRLRIMGAQFIIMHYTMRAMSLGSATAPGAIGPGPMGMGPGGPGGPGGMPPQPTVSPEVVKQFRAEQSKDMCICWDLLNAKFNERDMNKAAVVLKVDVAQRLEDAIKLESVFKELTGKQMEPQELMVAFTAAPFLADWKATFNLAKRLKRTLPGGTLDQFHAMSQAMPIPDYSVLYEMAEKYELDKVDTPPASSLKWETVEFDMIRVKFLNVNCGKFEDKQKELEEEIHKSPIAWEAVPTAKGVQLKRLGGFVQTVSFGDMPVSLCGPALTDRIHVKGFTELVLDPNAAAAAQSGMPPPMMDPSQMDMSNMTVIIQKEEWDVKQDPRATPDAPRIWRGTYQLDQSPRVAAENDDPQNTPVIMNFKLEMYEKGATCPETPISGNTEEIEAKADLEIKPAEADKSTTDAAKTEVGGGPPAKEEVVTEFDGLTLE